MNEIVANNKLPWVTICVPNYNKSKFIEYTLLSVFAQSYKNIEIIIIDDCSTDGSNLIIKAILKDCPFKYIYIQNVENKGVCAAANLGVRLSSGKYFQILSSDDIILPNKIMHQVNILEASQDDVAFIYSPTNVIDEDGLFINKKYFKDIGFDGNKMPSGNIFGELLNLNFIPALTTLIKLDCIKSVGGYDEKLRSEDWEMSLMLSKKYRVLYDKMITANYRIEKNSLMHSQKNKALVYDSFCRTLLKHTKQNSLFDKLIFKKIMDFATIIYVNDGNSAKFWYIKSLRYSFTIKNLIYTLSASAGIKYNWLKKWKLICKPKVI